MYCLSAVVTGQGWPQLGLLIVPFNMNIQLVYVDTRLAVNVVVKDFFNKETLS